MLAPRGGVPRLAELLPNKIQGREDIIRQLADVNLKAQCVRAGAGNILSSDGNRVNVGNFDSDRFNVNNNSDDNYNDNLGAGASRQFLLYLTAKTLSLGRAFCLTLFGRFDPAAEHAADFIYHLLEP